jgi:alpha-D-ribose 1-methylphosphonate 5-triphosphate diphosphatase PhnM
MALDLLLRNARIVSEARVFEGAVGVADGRIAFKWAAAPIFRMRRA